MFRVVQILVGTRGLLVALAFSAVALLAACGQKGPLFLPTGEAAAGRATLPQTLNPARAASAPVPSGTANPVPQQ
jgi:predicted small lipoprotein YifL